MQMTKAERQALISCCQIYLANHDSDLVEHLLWRLADSLGVVLP